MKTINNINFAKYIAFILFTIAIILMIKDCNKPNPEIITKIDTIEKIIYKDSIKYDTIIYSNVKLINDTVYVNDTIFDIDTIFFTINEHFAKIHYLDTILNDSTGFISISDTIHMNKLYTRKSDIKLYYRNNYIYDNNVHLWIGSEINQNSLGINAGLQKKKHYFGVGYNTNKEINLSYKYRIK